ncbi:MAG: acetyl-CoA hydrolase/transferase C-terminal domain-containing protein, partial [Dehalococcoidia bacterium]|nr:acetyl-CoA hydrolase/transferase C-terminal domain-containing protein [Dehalococcoidia bacterium]
GLSKGGKSIIAMTSTAQGGKASRIVPHLARGTAVTTPRFDMQYVVTEYGIADLRGKSLPQRARALISIAHPSFRDELSRQTIR